MIDWQDEMIRTKEVKAHFDALPTIYKGNFGRKKSGRSHEFLERLKLVKDCINQDRGTLLDCACGTGEITAAVLSSGNFSRAHVSDISEAMLDNAKEETANWNALTDIKYQRVNIFDYNKDSSEFFDVILCLGLIAHTGSLDILLEHLKSMLAPNGKIVLQSSLLDHWGIKANRFLTSKIYFRKFGYKINYFSLSEIRGCAEKSGLKVMSCKRYNFGFPFGDKISKVGNYWLEVLMEKFSSRHGSDAIFILTHK